MPKFIRSFILIITFLTRIPIPISFEFNTEDFNKGFKYFPLVGFIIGLFISIPLLLSSYISERVIAFFIIIFYLMIVGGLHIDGVSDVFDGIFSARTRERMLVIMEDSRIGAFGAIGLILYFLGMYIGLSQLLLIHGSVLANLDLALVTIVLMPVVGRTMALISAGFSSYAKEGGMGKSLITENTPLVSGILIVLLCVGCFFLGKVLFTAMMLTILLSLLITRNVHKVLKGITGDVVGMIVEVSQVIFILAVGIIYHL